MSKPDHIRAHAHSIRHRREVSASEHCGCFYCLTVFPSDEIATWLNEGDGTVLCPQCAIDSVIGNASEYPLTPGFLTRIRQRWFGTEV